MASRQKAGKIIKKYICIMKLYLALALLILQLVAGAQDKIYFLDGSMQEGNIIEVGPERLKVNYGSYEGEVLRGEVLLIEFASGFTEVINTPAKSLTVTSRDEGRAQQNAVFARTGRHSFFSLNSLGLMNADVSLHYEYILHNKNIGLGAMGVYNFNDRAGLFNAFISSVANSKKKHELGLFANYYSKDPRQEICFFLGAMLKYTYFTFSKVIETQSANGGIISTAIRYEDARAYHLATMATVGINVNTPQNFMFKAVAGLGGYYIKGAFREQFNYEQNRNRDPGSPKSNTVFLPKAYLGLNVGYLF